jgi:hypothetical protein
MLFSSKFVIPYSLFCYSLFLIRYFVISYSLFTHWSLEEICNLQSLIFISRWSLVIGR